MTKRRIYLPEKKHSLKIGNWTFSAEYRPLQKNKPVTELSTVPNVWGESENTGDPNTTQNTAEYSFDDLCNFFVSVIDSGKVQAQVVANMSISIVLDWLKKQDLSDISVDRLFLLKHYVETHQRYMYVAFLGGEGRTLLEDLNLVKCYISKEDSPEMKEIFQDKSLYVVPLEK